MLSPQQYYFKSITAHIPTKPASSESFCGHYGSPSAFSFCEFGGKLLQRRLVHLFAMLHNLLQRYAKKYFVARTE